MAFEYDDSTWKNANDNEKSEYFVTLSRAILMNSFAIGFGVIAKSGVNLGTVFSAC